MSRQAPYLLCGARLSDANGTEQRGGRREVLTPWRALIEATGLWRLFPRHPHFARFNLHQEPAVEGVVDMPTVSGALMLLPTARWRELGGMDEGLFFHVEDIDLCLRVLKAGGRVLYCGHARVVHHKGSSDVTRCFVAWHKTRGLVCYFFKHFEGPYPRWSLAVTALAGLPGDAFRLWRRWRGARPCAGPTPAGAPPPTSRGGAG